MRVDRVEGEVVVMGGMVSGLGLGGQLGEEGSVRQTIAPPPLKGRATRRVRTKELLTEAVAHGRGRREEAKPRWDAVGFRVKRWEGGRASR